METMSSETVTKTKEPEVDRVPARGVNPLLVLLIIVVVMLVGAGGWALWTYVGTTEISRRVVADEMGELRQQWREDETPSGSDPRMIENPEPGTAQWIIRIPALGSAHQWPVMVGIDHLDRGVAWYRGTAQPGQVGNFAISGHQATHGEPFAGWERLVEGQRVMIESQDAVYTYTLITSAGDLTVQADEAWVLDPVPGRDDLDPTQAFITLITHEDLVRTSDRSVVFGVLTATEMK